jgi:aryl-alcohol dehydrogenase-like predicted oxidoreductase
LRYRLLGKTGLKVSGVGFGAWAIGGSMWGPQDDEDSRLALHRALELGCNFIDTAWAYGAGHSERLIGGVMRERHERPVVATKVPPKNWNWDNPPKTPMKEVFPPGWVEAKTKESLKNLGLDCIDLLQLHTWNEQWNSQAETLLALVTRMKRSGMIRSFGLSLKDKGATDAGELVRQGQVDCLQIFFNLFYQEPVWNLFPLLRQHRTGVIARVPLVFGALTGRFTPQTRFKGDDHRKGLYAGRGLTTVLAKVEKLRFLETPERPLSRGHKPRLRFDDLNRPWPRKRTMGGSDGSGEIRPVPLAEAALKWTLSFPEVSVCIPGIRNARQAEANLRAGEGSRLPKDAVKKAAVLYRNNFGLPVKKAASSRGVHAVFMSGVRIITGKLKKKALRRIKTAGKTKRKKK